MATISSCAGCGYPVKVEAAGDQVVCANCGSRLEAIGGVEIPTPIFIGVLAFIGGMFFGKALEESARRGKGWLEQRVKGG